MGEPFMVVQGLIALALAGPTGGLFGLAYGTAIRVGYEIIYPLLFDQVAKDIKEGRDSGDAKLSQNTEIVIGKMNTLYTSIGGLEANAFGVNTGIKNALKQIEDDPELLELIKKNSNLLSQNITVNLSGTGLINEEGQVVSKPPLGELSELEKIEAGAVVAGKIRIASDGVCRKEFGNKFGTALFDASGTPVSCAWIIGGKVQERRLYPTGKIVKTDDFKVPFGTSDTKFTPSEIHWFNQASAAQKAMDQWSARYQAGNAGAFPKFQIFKRKFTRAAKWISTNSSWNRYGLWRTDPTSVF